MANMMQVTGMFLEYPRAKVILEWVRHVLAYGRNPRGAFDGFTLVGETRVGKTRLLEEIVDGQKDYIEETPAGRRHRRPVLLIETPSPITLKGLCGEIYHKLGLTAPLHNNTATVKNRTMDLLKEVGVDVVLFDEAHHIFRKDSKESEKHEVADYIKTLLNDRVCVVGLVGLPELELLVRSNEQLDLRLPYKLRLEGFDWRVEAERKEFRGILKMLEDALPLATQGFATSAESALRFWVASNGRIGILVQLLKYATAAALSHGDSVLSIDHVATAYQLGQSDKSALNPFRVQQVSISGNDRQRMPADAVTGLQARAARPNASDY